MLSALIEPHSDEAFFAEVWSKIALHVVGARPCSSDLLQVATLWAACRSDPERVDVVRGGLAHPLAEALPADIVRWLTERGASLRFRAIHEVHPPVAALATALGRDLNSPINVNVYFTPGEVTEGLAPHTDPYSVFVLQLLGGKHWQLLGGKSRDVVPFRQSKGTHGTLEVQAGDVLYLPARLRHKVRNARTEPSLHLAFGITATAEA